MIIERNKVIETIEKQGYKRILFQGPDGLRNQLVQLAKEITDKVSDIEILVDGERNFGACGIPFYKAVKVGVDAIFHFGHTEFPATMEQLSAVAKRVPVLYFPVYDDSKVTVEMIDELMKRLERGAKIAVVYSVQYKRQFIDIVKQLDKKGVSIINTRIHNFELNKWQIIGCNIGILREMADKVDGVVVVSGGLFHGLGVGLYSGLPILIVDIPRENIYSIEKELVRYRSLIAYNIAKAKDCENFGVIVSSRSFQFNYSTARYIHEYIINNLKKNSVLLMMDFISNESLEYFPSIDGFIQTACPRISIDDLTSFKRPILNIEQFLIFIGKKRFEEVYPWREKRLFQD